MVSDSAAENVTPIEPVWLNSIEVMLAPVVIKPLNVVCEEIERIKVVPSFNLIFIRPLVYAPVRST